MNLTNDAIVFGAKHRLSAFAIASLTALCVFAALDLDTAKTLTLGVRDATVSGFDWLFVYAVSGVLLVVVLLAFHPNASRRIGRDTDVPEFSRWAWFSMLFSAGLASGLVYWGTAEPITHFAGSPFASDTDSLAFSATKAVTVTIFHWGLHGWGLYAIAGLAIGLAAYRQGKPLSFSQALAPILGSKAAAGWPGRVVDLLALYGTVFGVATSIGLASSLVSNAGDYASNVVPMGFWLADDVPGHTWQTDWTVFYWGWWLAWTPFVALFIARISKGRTVREFILGVLLVPTLVVLVWMTVFGGTALHQELASAGAVSSAVDENYSLGLITMISNLASGGLQTLLIAVVALLLFTWLITSLDSATLVISHTLHMDHLGSMKVLWGFILGGVTCTLMLIGGLESLQAASIIIGLPMALLVLLLAVSAVKLVIRPLSH